MTLEVEAKMTRATTGGCGQRRVRPFPPETVGHNGERLTACFQFHHQGQDVHRSALEHVQFATVLAVPHDEPLTKFGTFPCSFNPTLCNV